MLRRPTRAAREARRTGIHAAAVAALMAMITGCGAPESPMEDAGMAVDDRAMTAAAAPAAPAPDRAWEPVLTADGRLLLPPREIWREWPYVGTPLTPNALNDGEAPFPEFHSVYIDPVSWEHWRRTGTFREGTVLAKELVSVFDDGARPDGSTDQVSGRGYFMGEFIGFEIAYKSAEHFPEEPGNWAYFSFGHHPPPYAESVAPMPVASCNSCHEAAADDDFVFTQFYPVLRAARGTR